MVDWEAFYNAFRRPGFIPGYEIQNHLGGGAFGEVYKAKKTSIGKSYAIKFLRLDDETQRDAIDRELDSVRLFASIDHPNLVTIEDMGVAMDVPFLIMGYAGEDTLAKHLKRGDLDPERAMRYFVQTCRGVLALHDRRLAHFDLKPSNIFLKGDVARVGDYGLAKLLTEGRQTLSFGRGTPHYMAPEILKNRGDHRADIYSLGVILFESLTFRLPYGETSAIGVVRETDRPPEFPDDFPARPREAVERCLRIEPDDRFESVDALLEALGQTARQGDSVRLRFSELGRAPAGAGVPAPSPGKTPERADGATRREDSSATREDLKQAAAELARGAVGVARGVWNGVRERVSKSEEAADAEASRKAVQIVQRLRPKPAADAEEEERAVPTRGRPAEDIVSVSTLDEPDEPAEPEELAGAAAAAEIDRAALMQKPWFQELSRSREEKEREKRPGLLAAEPALPVESMAGTVPVPPRAEGGWPGAIVQSVVVGAEIMGALVSGPVMVGLRSTASVFDRVVRGVPGVLGGVIRLIMLLVLMALLGGLVSFIILGALSLPGT